MILWGVLDEGREVYGQRQSLRIEGVYQGENLFIQNPLDEKGSFCIHDIQINGEEVLHEPKRSAIALDFTSYSLQTVLRVLITHRAGCVPLCLNAEVLRKGGGFAFTQVLLQRRYLVFFCEGRGDGFGVCDRAHIWRGMVFIDAYFVEGGVHILCFTYVGGGA